VSNVKCFLTSENVTVTSVFVPMPRKKGRKTVFVILPAIALVALAAFVVACTCAAFVTVNYAFHLTDLLVSEAQRRSAVNP
jgi:hypothetical protein